MAKSRHNTVGSWLAYFTTDRVHAMGKKHASSLDAVVKNHVTRVPIIADA
jgi:hypothetical protein